MLKAEAEALRQRGDLQSAIRLYQRLANEHPGPDAFNSLALAYADAEKFSQSRAWIGRSLKLREDQPEAWARLAAIENSTEHPAEALAASDRAVALAPGFGHAHFHRGLALASLDRLEDALASLTLACDLLPGNAQFQRDRARVLRRLGRLDEALQVLEAAVKSDPEHVIGLVQLSTLQTERGELAQAHAALERAIELQPDNADAHAQMAELLLLSGDYKRGWERFEWRWQTRARRGNPLRKIAKQFATPPDLAGRRVLLTPEAGWGDYLMFLRYAPLLADRGASLVLSAPAPLQRLFRANGFEVVSSEGELPPADLVCPIMSLPLWFGTTLETVPARFPYLSADPELAESWRKRLGPARAPRIGLAWWGSKGRGIDRIAPRRRSVPLASLAPLWNLPFEFHSLQAELGEEDADAFAASPLVDHRASLTDFSETAALISQMDMVISIDTAVAHLAGAMARPLHVMLPWYSDYRWGPRGGTSPWYPAARLFRQEQVAQWSGVVEAVRQDLVRKVDAARRA